MAIGLGRMFGFRFPENFAYPYVAASVQDFWRRWHMSLSAWFRDYVYVPLGGNRTTPTRVYLNLVTVFFLCGLWHGANWTFVVWGLFHGVFLVLERVGLSRLIKAAPPPVRHLYSLLVVIGGWVFFRAETLSGALAMLAAMAGFGGAEPATYTATWYWNPEVLLAFGAGVIGSMPVVPLLAQRLATRPDGQEPRALGWWPSLVATGALCALFLASIMLSAARTYNPFIYFRF
jgi:alginate O-acetyltransferase complex protein AlgI